ncbi:hypothetical protein M0811_10011 [Anaeramoeba ignava]|uniref:Fibronectin type-III domain-containing protein n=1 Tax=Anaeramoeba ignava TaxID=1746090 RepID=A0A9Q0LEY9_ANAIG|nr:hypothetical protein M0811_10011 [Anaeramoeba ignava]
MKTIFFLFFFFNLILIQSEQISSSSITLSSPIASGYYGSNGDYLWNLLNMFSSNLSNYGGSVSVSDKGNVFAVGAYFGYEAFIYRYNGTVFNLETTLIGPDLSFYGKGISVSRDGNVTAVGAYYIKQVFIYIYNGTDWNQEQILNESASYYGLSVSVSGNGSVIVVGASNANKAFVYRYNGTDWNLEITLSETEGGGYGVSVSVSQNGDTIAIGSYGSRQVFIYRYNGTDWNLETSLNQTAIDSFGRSVSVSGNGDVLAVGTDFSNQAFIYRYNGTDWNLEKNFTGASSSRLGSSVSVSGNGDAVVIGACGANQTFIYRYKETDWDLETTLSAGLYSYFGLSVSIDGNFTVVGAPGLNQVFAYKASPIPQVNILNCSSLFSSFDCYWNKIEFPSSLIYQINYGYDWIDIDSPILEDENVYYQLFNSSFYDNITGNEYYSIQIRTCDNATMKCGEPSSFVNLTTKIDSVKDFHLSNSTSDSINVTWNYPNVQINEGIAHLDHYNISYFIQSQPTLISFISVDNSSLDYLLNNLECESDYNISICGCRTQECEGDDKGEIVESSISTIFGQVSNLSCSISNSIDINCTWNQPINCSIPFYYNFTYQSIYQNDSGNYQPTLTNQQFTAQFPNQEYQINISSCNSNDTCGEISSISIKTDNLTAPIIYETISKIEEIEFNFTKLTNSNNYSISLDNETNWQKFTSLDLSGNEVIGTISGISGNVEYNISIRGCIDLNCETPYLGLPSSIISTRAKLGNITSLSCSSLNCGFKCNWNPLILSSGLKAYSFTYNSTSICLSNSTTSYSVSNLIQGEYYEVSVYSSSDLNCSFNEYSGINSTTSVTILSCSTQSTSGSSSHTTAIVVGIAVPIVVIGSFIGIFLFVKKRHRRNSKNKESVEQEKELEDQKV